MHFPDHSPWFVSVICLITVRSFREGLNSWMKGSVFVYFQFSVRFQFRSTPSIQVVFCFNWIATPPNLNLILLFLFFSGGSSSTHDWRTGMLEVRNITLGTRLHIKGYEKWDIWVLRHKKYVLEYKEVGGNTGEGFTESLGESILGIKGLTWIQGIQTQNIFK